MMVEDKVILKGWSCDANEGRGGYVVTGEASVRAIAHSLSPQQLGVLLAHWANAGGSPGDGIAAGQQLCDEHRYLQQVMTDALFGMIYAIASQGEYSDERNERAVAESNAVVMTLRELGHWFPDLATR